MPLPFRNIPWLSPRRLPSGFGPRAAGVFFTLLIQLLLGSLLLSLAPPYIRQKMAEMVMFSVDAPAEDKASEDPLPPEAAKAPVESRAPTPPADIRQKPIEPAPVMDRPDVVIPLDPPTAAAAPATPTVPAAPAPVFGPPDLRRKSSDSGADSPRVEGSGPNGEPLYAASWYREPYDDELKGYLSTARAPGWGLIACRTAPDYRVEDCIIIGESPIGSGIARAVQAAAWQFKVRPPRIAGRYQVGEWVQIRIDYGIGPKRRQP